MRTHSQERLPAALFFGAATGTSAVAVGLVLGWGAALCLAGIGLISVIAGIRGPDAAKLVAMSPYMLVIVAKLADDCIRFGLGFSPALGDLLPRRGDANVLTDRVWFAGAVVLPVAVMLLGGYLIGRGYPAGTFLAWWTPLFAVADGLWGLTLGPVLDWTHPAPAAVVLASALAEILIATWAAQALLRRGDPNLTWRATSAGLTSRQRNLWTVLFVALVVVYGSSVFQQAGLLPLGVIAGSMMGGLIGWRTTTARHPADPAYHVPLYLLLLALFYLHVGEEALTGFNRSIASISGTSWSDGPFTLLIGLLGPAVWAFGAWSLWRRQPFGNFILWFMIVGMILGEPTHLVVFPVIAMQQTGAGYEYFSGMYTALFPMVPAILALTQIVRVHRTRERGRPDQLIEST